MPTATDTTEVVTLTIDLTAFTLDVTTTLTMVLPSGTIVITVDPHTMH